MATDMVTPFAIFLSFRTHTPVSTRTPISSNSSFTPSNARLEDAFTEPHGHLGVGEAQGEGLGLLGQGGHRRFRQTADRQPQI